MKLELTEEARAYILKKKAKAITVDMIPHAT